MDKNSKIYKILRYIAIVGNVVYFLWILYNGISGGFTNIGTVQGVSLVGLMVLLILNIFLFFRKEIKVLKSLKTHLKYLIHSKIGSKFHTLGQPTTLKITENFKFWFKYAGGIIKHRIRMDLTEGDSQRSPRLRERAIARRKTESSLPSQTKH